MSSIVYSGGTIVNTTFTTTTGTRAEIVTGLGAVLVSAGWANLGSGLYKSATTASPKSNSIRVKLIDPGSGNCAQLKIQNEAGDRVSQAHFLLPGAGKIYRVIACQYNFFCFTPGSSAAREFVCGGTLHIPDFLNGVVTGSLGWMHGNAQNDGDSTVRTSVRTRLDAFENSAPAQSQIRNGALLDLSNNTWPADQSLVSGSYAGLGNAQVGYRWSDDSVGVMEAILCFGIASSGDEAKRQGLIHNCLVSAESFAADTVPSAVYDGHHWWAITNGNVGVNQQQARGTLFVATD